MLAKIESLLATNQVLSAKQLAKQLEIDEQTLAPMMQLLIKRNKVLKHENNGCSGGCGCTVEASVSYQWLVTKNNQTKNAHIAVMPSIVLVND